MNRCPAWYDLAGDYRWRPLFNAAKFGCWRACSNAAKTRNPLKLDGVPQTTEPISVVSGLKFTILCGHLEDMLLFEKIISIVDTRLSCEDIAGQICTMVRTWRFFASFLRPVFPASCLQHISDLHSKFASMTQHVWKYGRHPIYGHWD